MGQSSQPHGRVSRTLVATLVLLLVTLLACKKSEENTEVTVAPAPAPVSTGPCPDGRSADPKPGEFKPAQTAFKEKNYTSAKTLLATMATKYPNSSSIRVWQGDAALFDKKAKSSKAAEEAITFYEDAVRLHDKGCGLPIYERYYVRMGFGYAYLRLKDGESALKHLEKAEEEFKNSAGLYYNLARAHCRADNLDKCVSYFDKALATAQALKRPKFLRSHYSLAYWVSRSRTQSEFIKLRRDKRYRETVKKYDD